MKPRTLDATAILAAYDRLGAALVGAGFPATSPWWRDAIERFVRSGCRRWVIRAGRRAGKSSTLARLAVAWALWGTWHVPAGDIAVIPFVSVSKDESAARLRTIAAVLTVLGLPFDVRGDELELRGARPVLFRSIACTSSAVVGFTSVAIFGDEVARWESRDTSANPARDVFGSLTPTLATQPSGFSVLCSSPWSTDDFHAELFALGDDGHQVTSFAPTWVANPTITEATTHDMEPDLRTWAREYAAEPGSTVSAALDPADVAAAFKVTISGEGAGFVAIDASSLRGDGFTWLAGREGESDELIVQEVGGWEGDALRRVSMAEVVATIAAKAKEYGTRTVFGDQREEAALRALFDQHGIALQSFAWSEPSKDEAVMLLRRMLRERRVSLCAHDGLRRELASMKARLMPSGRTKYETNGLDFASALITLAHAAVTHHVLTRGERSTAIIVTNFRSASGRGIHESGGRALAQFYTDEKGQRRMRI